MFSKVPGAIDTAVKAAAVEVIGKERLVIADLITGQNREFVFHPYDRRSVFPDSIHWVSDHYLVFQGSRTASIWNEFSAKLGRMKPPLTKALGPEKLPR